MSLWNEIAIILLASGQSTRFGDQDKLLQPLKGRPLLSYSAGLLRDAPLRFAIAPKEDAERILLLRQMGWQTLLNPTPEAGQGQSLCLGMKAAYVSKAKMALILLADMPFITDAYLEDMLDAYEGHEAIMSQADGILMPPAIFSAANVKNLMTLEGDIGAREAFSDMLHSRIYIMKTEMSLDIDTPEDLQKAEESGSSSGGNYA